MCKWDRGELKCKRQCQYAHATSADCAADSNCYWTDAGKCLESCATKEELACRLDSMCMWGSGICIGNCAVRYPSTTNSTACNKDTQCMFDDTTLSCKKKCTLITDLYLCAKEDRCMVSSGGECIEKCGLGLNESACTSNVDCLWGQCIVPFADWSARLRATRCCASTPQCARGM